MSESIFIRACRRQSVPYTPIWIMRQAGRYMKEYRAVRDKVSFLELCRSPELVTEVTLTAANMLGVDAAIIFADILLICEPLGFNLDFVKGDGPTIYNPLRSKVDLSRVENQDVSLKLSYVGDAIGRTRGQLDPSKALIGFAGAPFTVASYMIEGGSSKTFEHTRVLRKNDPTTWNSFMQKISSMTAEYLSMQIECGADAIQLFDSWVGQLSAKEYRTSVLPHLNALIQDLRTKHPGTPLIYFGTSTEHLFDEIKTLPIDVIGVDSKADLAAASNKLSSFALQGNMDPTTLLCEKEIIEAEAKDILRTMKGRNGFIFNLGHGILPPTPFEHAKFLVDLVHRVSAS